VIRMIENMKIVRYRAPTPKIRKCKAARVILKR